MYENAPEPAVIPPQEAGPIDDRPEAAVGRPRSRQAQHAILTAAAALLRERGLRGTSIEAIAARAGVSKKTIYRWWPSKGTLALDAFYLEWAAAQGAVPAAGGLALDLRARMRTTTRLLTRSELGRTLAALIAEAQSDPELAAAYEHRVLERQRAQIRTIFERAVERGEISDAAEIEAAIDLLQGALYLRLLHTHAPLDPEFADAIVRLVTRGLLPRTENEAAAERP